MILGVILYIIFSSGRERPVRIKIKEVSILKKKYFTLIFVQNYGKDTQDNLYTS